MNGALKKFNEQWGNYPAVPQEVADAFNAGREAGLQKAINVVESHDCLPTTHECGVWTEYGDCNCVLSSVVENLKKELEITDDRW